MAPLSFLEQILKETQSLLNAGEEEASNTVKKDMQGEGTQILIPFIGGFSSGKSSLINALLGENILSTDITPETALPVELSFGKKISFTACKQDSAAEKLNLVHLLDEDFTALAQAGGWINAQLPQLKSWPQATLVDLPGWSSGEGAHEQQLDNYLLRLNQTHLDKHTLYIIAVSADEGTLRESTRERLSNLDMGNSPYILVITKTDKRTSEDLDSVCQHINEVLTKTLSKAPAKTLLSSARKKQIDDLRTAISEMLDSMLPKPQIDKSAISEEVNKYLEKISNALNETNDFADDVWDDTWDEINWNILDELLDFVFYENAKVRADVILTYIDRKFKDFFEIRFNKYTPTVPKNLINNLEQLGITPPEKLQVDSINTASLLRNLKKHLYLAVEKSKPGFLSSDDPESVGERIKSKIHGMKNKIIDDLKSSASINYRDLNTAQTETWQRIKELIG